VVVDDEPGGMRTHPAHRLDILRVDQDDVIDATPRQVFQSHEG
jgi:hypothetical protein